MQALKRAPRVFPAPEFVPDLSKPSHLRDEAPLDPAPARLARGPLLPARVQAVFYESVPYGASPTRVFAWLGVPARRQGEKLPGVVLVHGGAGTAFLDWVRLWNSRGYVAIAMDNTGALPYDPQSPTASWNSFDRPRHAFSGPPGWGGFNAISEAPRDQWSYHATASVIVANSLLRSLPEVDARKIGVTGVSWGGYLACLAASLDDRFAWAAPVYGTGFLRDDSLWKPVFERMKAGDAARWDALWDPRHYLPRSRVPFLWVAGTNDFAFQLPALQKSYFALPTQSTPQLAVRVRMPHAHGGPGEMPREIWAFAESFSRRGAPLPRIVEASRHGASTEVAWRSRVPIVKVELAWTSDRGLWVARQWQTREVPWDRKMSRARTSLPSDASAFFWNVSDERGVVSSSAHQEIASQNADRNAASAER